jgi:hypothetical protein
VTLTLFMSIAGSLWWSRRGRDAGGLTARNHHRRQRPLTADPADGAR